MSNAKAKREVKVIDLSGTYYEMGAQYGSACAQEIRNFLDITYKRIAPRDVLVPAAQLFLHPSEEFAPELVDMQKGIAEGAKVDFIEIFLCSIVEIALYPFFGLTSPYLGGVGEACTDFAASGEATSDGKLLVGQNYDDTALWEESLILLRMKPTKGLSVLMLALAPPMLPLCGLNSAGLARCGSGLRHKDFMRTYVTVPLLVWNLKVLWSSETIGRAIGAIASMKYFKRVNLLYGSQEGDIVDLEILGNDIGYLYPEKGILVHANHLETERFKSGELQAFERPDSFVRAQRLTRLMEKHRGELSVDVMKELLQDHGGYPESICRHPKAEDLKTDWSIIMCPEDQKMYLARGNPCENEYVEYKL